MLMLCNVVMCYVFFYNGVFYMFDQVMVFYNECSILLQKFYLCGVDGKVDEYDDILLKYCVNVDVIDVLFDCKFGDKFVMIVQDIKDIEVFLNMFIDLFVW